MPASTLSILIPLYNEQNTIEQSLNKIRQVKLINDIKKQIIVIDDGSTDKSHERIQNYLLTFPELIYLRQSKNKGKGAAIAMGISRATGEYIVIQDADLEYDPQEYNSLLQPMIDGKADVVFGSRFMGDKAHRVLFYWHSIANRFITTLSNMFTNLNLTDIECGYKLFNAKILKSLQLKEKRFGFEPEVTARIARVPGIRIYEVGISYYGRTYEEGKKIGWQDGFRAIYCILKYGLFRL